MKNFIFAVALSLFAVSQSGIADTTTPTIPTDSHPAVQGATTEQTITTETNKKVEKVKEKKAKKDHKETQKPTTTNP